MNITIFWILFLSLWAIVPLMIIKGRKDTPNSQIKPLVKDKKNKGWFKK